MDTNSCYFSPIPVEIRFIIFNKLTFKETYNLGKTCHELADQIFGHSGWMWFKLGKLLNIRKANKINIQKFIIEFRSKEDPNFFSGTAEARLLKLKLKIRPPVIEAVQKMEKAAKCRYKDHQTFDSLAPYVLPHVKEDILRSLYTSAISTLPKATIDNMLAIRAPQPNPIFFMPSLLTRAEKNPEFNQYLESGLSKP